jgi:hypothetical protein
MVTPLARAWTGNYCRAPLRTKWKISPQMFLSNERLKLRDSPLTLCLAAQEGMALPPPLSAIVLPPK